MKWDRRSNIATVYIVEMLIFAALQVHAEVWQPDLGNGMYKNPIIFADYSDPDMIRVGDGFYMTASSFSTAHPAFEGSGELDTNQSCD